VDVRLCHLNVYCNGIINSIRPGRLTWSHFIELSISQEKYITLNIIFLPCTVIHIRGHMCGMVLILCFVTSEPLYLHA